jgi:CRISPR/Cas system-associated protein Cas7 (RAMP superfamily)
MKTVIAKVVAQTEPVFVPSKKQENGQVAKSMIRLKELGGDYEDEYQCTLFGNLAQCKFAVGKTVVASLRFQTHESNGSYFQDVVANDIQFIN